MLATAPLSLCGTPQRPLPTHPLLPPFLRKLRELVPLLRALHRTPVVLCSDAGIFHGSRPPSAIFSADYERPDSAVACFVAADHSFDPSTGALRPVLGVGISGIERLPIANSFIAEMVGCIGMVQFQILFECVMGPFVTASLFRLSFACSQCSLTRA